MDFAGLTANNGGGKKLNMNENVELITPPIIITNFTYHLPFL
jgi:hypothetical protein